MLIPIKMNSRVCIIPDDPDLRLYRVTPFRAINFYATEEQKVPSFISATGPIDWVAHARQGIDVRFLMCEIIRLRDGMNILGELAQIDLDSGRWLLASLENERLMNFARRAKFSMGLDDVFKEWLHPAFEDEIHAVRTAIARRIAGDALDAIKKGED